MKILMYTALITTVSIVTSSSLFARGHDVPERYEWEAQIEKIESSQREPSSEESLFDHENKNDENNHKNFKQDYSFE